MWHQHLVVRNEKFEGIKRARWRDNELTRVVHMEMEHGDLININQYIILRLPGRTDEAVKNVRKRHEYFEILEDHREKVCLDAILNVNGLQREKETLATTEKKALLNEYKVLFEE
ncbi:hypothetical protein QYM36_017284 [Artemia franciscana]|uniref:Uncharacterized protein n=1 Tax=Artemia franciscana TaxID=6661 RepID=A0AA88H9W7_ARTSF|nr:hypothetical protein QYM36_017070 [Artemia franciscana]KAK2705182.1 hypothetical protein QYM36_017284 [Artemia franciscana]